MVLDGLVWRGQRARAKLMRGHSFGVRISGCFTALLRLAQLPGWPSQLLEVDVAVFDSASLVVALSARPQWILEICIHYVWKR